MRSLLLPLLFALLGFGVLVYLTYPQAPAEPGPAAADGEETGERPPLEPDEEHDLEGRVVDRSGAPLALDALTLVAVDEGEWTTLSARVERDGTFRAKRVAGVPEGDVELRLWSRDARGAVERFANLEATLGPETVALGDITLGPLPTLVAGVVRDVAGRPVTDRAIEVLQLRHRGMGEPLEYAPADAPYPLDGRTGANGSFVLRGLPKAHGLALQVAPSAEGEAAGGPFLFAPRDEAFEARLGPPGALRVDVTLESEGEPVDLGFADVWLQAWPAGVRRSEELALYVPTVAAGADGRVTFTELTAGRYDLSIHLASPENPPAQVVEDIVVTPGAEAGEPVLVLVDALHVFHIRAVDESNQELAARIEHRAVGTTTWLPATPTSADPARPGVVSSWPALDLRVSAAGYRPAVLEDVDGDRAVVLERQE